MGHTKFENLKDLTSELEKVRNFEGIKEKKPGVFYFKAQPFLHFHDKDGVRWAHLKTPAGWLKVDVDFQATSKMKKDFIKQVSAAFLHLKK